MDTSLIGGPAVARVCGGRFATTTVRGDHKFSLAEVREMLRLHALAQGFDIQEPLILRSKSGTKEVEFSFGPLTECDNIPLQDEARSALEKNVDSSFITEIVENSSRLFYRAVCIDNDRDIESSWKRFDEIMSFEKNELNLCSECYRYEFHYENSLRETKSTKIKEIGYLLAKMPPPTLAILDHDGGIDDFIAMVILAASQAAHMSVFENNQCDSNTFENKSPLSNAVRPIQLLGVTVVDADCYADSAVEVCNKTLALLNHTRAWKTPYPESVNASAPFSPNRARSSRPLLSSCLQLVPVAASATDEITRHKNVNLVGTAAPFPSEWRRDCLKQLDQPILNMDHVLSSLKTRAAMTITAPEIITETDASGKCNYVIRYKVTTMGDFEEDYIGRGQELLSLLVMAAPRPVVIVVTGPLTNVAYCMKKYGKAFSDKVKSVVVMGGALDVHGNVMNVNLPLGSPDSSNENDFTVIQSGSQKSCAKESPVRVATVDGSAEWNIYWDALAAKRVLEGCDECSFKSKVLFTLDGTNAVPVTEDFVRGFARVIGKQEYAAQSVKMPTPLSIFVGGAWAQCTYQHRCFGAACGYYAWDALTAAVLVVPDIAQCVPTRIKVQSSSDHANINDNLSTEKIYLNYIGYKPNEGRTIRTHPRPIQCVRVPGEDYVPTPEVGAEGGLCDVACSINCELFQKLMYDICRI